MASTPSISVRRQPSRAMRRVLVLLALSAFINFVDRGNLSAAAPLLKTELALSDPGLGILLAAFFWSYALFQIASGWLVDHLDVKWMLAAGFFIWSVATAATGLVGSFALPIRTPRSRSRRIGRVPCLFQDPRPLFPGRSARSCQFHYPHRLLCRTGLRPVLWRHPDGQVWLAFVFPGPRTPQLDLALAVAAMDAPPPRRTRNFRQSSRQTDSGNPRDPETALRLGHLCRPRLPGLFVLFLPYVDAHLPGAWPEFLHGPNGGRHGSGLCFVRPYRGPLWLAFRSLDCFRGKSDSGAKGIYQRWNGRRGNLRGSLRSRWPEAHYGDGGLGRCVARHVFLQRLGHYSDAGRTARRWPVDGDRGLCWKPGRGGGPGADRLCLGAHGPL